ncbi:hypothetical protein MPSEU_000917500 [Mayamaea pseudoterrestris]|nr:hypothetical protein MPSEU_000917500 [Mayamaea pseudoterrestris]
MKSLKKVFRRASIQLGASSEIEVAADNQSTANQSSIPAAASTTRSATSPSSLATSSRGKSSKSKTDKSDLLETGNSSSSSHSRNKSKSPGPSASRKPPSPAPTAPAKEPSQQTLAASLSENNSSHHSALSRQRSAHSKAEKIRRELDEARLRSRQSRLAKEEATSLLNSQTSSSTDASAGTSSSTMSTHSSHRVAQTSSAILSELPSEEMKLIAKPASNVQNSQCFVVPNDPPDLVRAYEQVPLLEQTLLPRGGASVDTKAVGRIQFGIPPETIKDSMKLGIPVPQVYIVPVDRFCREMGPALGVNLAEFEFPAYFNFFVYKKKCTLVVDSDEAEENIRRVFGETLLGPHQFRREDNPIAYEEEDFAPEFPREAIPNFQKEFKHFRIMPDGKELEIETLLNFHHFKMNKNGKEHNVGVPPNVINEQLASGAPDEQFDGGVGGLHDANADIDSDDDDDIPGRMTNEYAASRTRRNKWSFAQLRHVCDLATIWPVNATDEQIKNRSVPRAEIYKMPGGTEYFVHDIDANGIIIGKARFSGHLRVSEQMVVDGFGGQSIMEDIKPKRESNANDDPSEALESVFRLDAPPTFHPPSFGVTVLGNSHGFDKSGSVSGYVLWINGRGVMIDPPPYSSATLEREGIRPRAIVGIILTHCHADHDAGAFQKVLTGSPVVVITTPTIYKSFIRKYAALSALSPAILRHCHRFKPAIIGQPLRFQGATFRFMYSLHTIPCVGFRVEWRGRSMVFTGDHFNSPEGIDKLQETGVLSRARADDLRSLPLQECDLILHEAGAPPIHTPLEVLMKLPQRIKDRLYVVHTAALPDNCDLRVAPTGTAGTIRLDQIRPGAVEEKGSNLLSSITGSQGVRDTRDLSSSVGNDDARWDGNNEYETISEESVSMGSSGVMMSSFAHLAVADTAKKATKGRHIRNLSVYSQPQGEANQPPPLVALRPASSTDAWFILNLLSAVPFLSSLCYTHTMEVLETARVDAYPMNNIVVPASKRNHMLCVVWEGTCSEQATTATGALGSIQEESGTIWHAGDWTGPISLQPDRRLSGESSTSTTHDIVALSSVGVKVITIEMQQLHAILKAGSSLYATYLERTVLKQKARDERLGDSWNELDAKNVLYDYNVLELLNSNSALRKLNAVQKRHLECLAEGPIAFAHGDRMWRAGTAVDKAYLIVSGSCSFTPKRRNAGSVAAIDTASVSQIERDGSDVGDSMRFDALRVMDELGKATSSDDELDEAGFGASQSLDIALSEAADFDKLSRGLQKRADFLAKEGSSCRLEFGEEEHATTDTAHQTGSQLDHTFTDESDHPGSRSQRVSMFRRRSSRARHANKVLGRLYSRQASAGGLVFSRGHFLGDMSKMVSGLLANDATVELGKDDSGPEYGLGDNSSEQLNASSLSEDTGRKSHLKHSSTLIAGKDGCVALAFPKSSLVGFLDEYPGFLLSLLGTQAIV